MTGPMIESLSAITLVTQKMDEAVSFYRALGFELHYGGETASFTSFHAGTGYLNLISVAEAADVVGWGRVIFHVANVDAIYEVACSAGFVPEAPPRDAEWGERYFHIQDPDGHELSFARPLARREIGD